MRRVFLALAILALGVGVGFRITNGVKISKNYEIKAQTANVDWPQFQHDAQHTGHTTAFVAPSYRAAWVWMDKSHIAKNFVSGSGKSVTDNFADKSTFVSNVIFAESMQPIAANGKTVFGSMNGTTYAVNSVTGDNLWDRATGNAVIGSAAYVSGVFVVPSMDGKIYGLNEADGTVKWTYQTKAGVSASPVIANGKVFVGSRDGSFYALDGVTGAFLWKYTTRDPGGKFGQAPIISPAAVSEDNSMVFFGAENMYVYALSTIDGSEKWAPIKVFGQSFQYSWPVVKGNLLFIRPMSSLQGTESEPVTTAETVLAGLSTNPTWAEEKTAINGWLTQTPQRKSLYVFNVATGQEPYQVAMARLAGFNVAPEPPVVDSQNRILMYWRSKVATFLQSGTCYGTSYCPDIAAMDLVTGDRVNLTNNNTKMGVEIDNVFNLTTGGDYVYMQSGFRGLLGIRQTDGQSTRVTTALATWDCADNRGWGYQIIYFGNDGQANTCPAGHGATDPRPPRIYANTTAMGSGAAISSIGTASMLFVNEVSARAIVGITH